jgi:Cu/Ag efflux protein CusF
MNRKIMLPMLGLALAFGWGATHAQAQQNQESGNMGGNMGDAKGSSDVQQPAQAGQQAQQAMPSDMDMQKISATVKKVDKTNHKVTFEAQLSPDAKLESNGQPIMIDQLKSGDSVRASFDPTTGDVNKLDVIKKGGAQGKSGSGSNY